MKKYLSIVLLVLTFNNSFAAENNPIVDVNVVEEFGIWRVYNSGSYIYIVDSIKGRIIRVEDDGYFNYHLPEGGSYQYQPGTSGTTAINTTIAYPNSIFSTVTETITPTAHLQDGLFGFEKSKFQINGETMFIYDKDNYNNVT